MKGFLNGFRYAISGIRLAARGRNFRIQCAIAIAVLMAAAVLDVSKGDVVTLLMFIGLVLGFEMLNTAIEEVVNFISPEFHPLAGKIKDLSAGAVLVMATVSAIAGFIIFTPYVKQLLEIYNM